MREFLIRHGTQILVLDVTILYPVSAQCIPRVQDPPRSHISHGEGIIPELSNGSLEHLKRVFRGESGVQVGSWSES